MVDPDPQPLPNASNNSYASLYNVFAVLLGFNIFNLLLIGLAWGFHANATAVFWLMLVLFICWFVILVGLIVVTVMLKKEHYRKQLIGFFTANV